MAGHPYYEATGACSDPPELLDIDSDGPTLALPERDLDVVVRAVRERQAAGGVCQEKIDGCWCALEIGVDGKVKSATSRAGIPLRYARSETPWIGTHIADGLAGYTFVGELEAGTARAAETRDDERELRPRLYVFGVYDRDGRDMTEHLLTVISRVPAWLRDRLLPVPQALPGEDWGDFCAEVLERGGEGVVIRTPDGERFRYKPIRELDRVVLRVFAEPDRWGKRRVKAEIGFCVAAGERPRYHRAQVVLLPRWLDAGELRRQKRVVRVLGSAVDRRTGVIRHARITDLRPREEKQAWETRAA